MHIIWENLSAMLVVMGIALLMVLLNERNQRVLTETTAYNMLKTQGLAFTDIVKRDMRGVVSVETTSESFPDSTFTFRARIGQDTTVRQIRYKRKKTGSTIRHVDNGNGSTVAQEIDLYEIQRWVGNQRSGGSSDAIAEWEIQALNENQEPITDPAQLGNTRMVFVRFEMTSPVLDTQVVDRVRWESTFVPPSLSRSDVL